jgi:hypothetical protein
MDGEGTKSSSLFIFMPLPSFSLSLSSLSPLSSFCEPFSDDFLRGGSDDNGAGAALDDVDDTDDVDPAADDDLAVAYGPLIAVDVSITLNALRGSVTSHRLGNNATS